ncbi:hypothetical protein VOLCADRAFT_40597, partial [Volvox carteri f. nagariensis]
PAFSVWGANTNVGKTLVSVGLAYAAAAHRISLSYVKPVQTGFPEDCDARLVVRGHACLSVVRPSCVVVHRCQALACGGVLDTGPHAAATAALAGAKGAAAAAAGAQSRCTTLFAWRHAVSPHLAVRLEGASEDGAGFATANGNGALLLLETAGGVTSPAPSGRLTVDVLRPLRHLPAVLVGDARLGGISATLSSYDSLVARGWDVEAVHISHNDISNPRMIAPPPRPRRRPRRRRRRQGHDVRSQGLDPHLRNWLVDSLPAFSELLAALFQRHQRRLTALLASRAAAETQLWWPFTQHAGLTQGSATIVDGRCGETWTALAPSPPPTITTASAAAAALPPPALVTLYDASGSWWTQAATPALQPEIARAVSYAAGRYLHVLFAEVAHEPALRAAAALLAGPGAGWADRVFFSDDGSTAVEVALKMAFRKFLADRGELQLGGGGGGGGGGELMVLGLQGAYHGDTLGAQDCVAPSVFNGPLQSPWYRGRGLFLEPPYVGMRQQLPTWASLDEILSYSSSTGDGGAAGASEPLSAAYRTYIESAIDEFEAAAAAAAAAAAGGAAVAPSRLAACVMEPLLQGAGGMLVVEPGFQRAVAAVCRRRRLPLVLDEVFTGLYRLGSLTAAATLGVTPDIACYGKLLTGGAVPMAATLATREVFEAFSGPSKLFALLHGHSYTAYPIGCAAAVASLELLSRPETNPNICAPGRCPKSPVCDTPCGRLLPFWDEQHTVSELSHHPLVTRVAAVGTVLAVELATQSGGGGGGYHASGVGPIQVVRRLRDVYGIYARPLGQVVYLMVPPTARRETAT